MKLKVLAALPLAAALVLGPTLGTAAFAATARPAAVKAAAPKAAAPKTTVPKTKPVPAPPRKPRPAPVQFTAVGVVASVDAATNTVTVTVKAGVRDLAGKTVVVAVAATAKIILDDVVVPLAALPAGAKVTVHGLRSDNVLTAAKVIATTRTV